MTTVVEAEADVIVLQRKRARLIEYGREIADEKSAAAIQARTYEPGARARVREINSELAVLDAELRNTDAALTEAGRRLAIAQRETQHENTFASDRAARC